MRLRISIVLTVLICFFVGCQGGPEGTAESKGKIEGMIVFVGTYTGGDSEGIYSFDLDLETGALANRAVMAGPVDPSFLAIHPNKKWLYAVNEGGAKVGAFKISEDDYSLEVNGDYQPSEGGAPCHIIVERSGKNVLVANYTGGNVTVLPIADDGSLKPASDVKQHEGSSVTNRQKGPHAHSINVDASNRFAVAADLGLDKVLVYKLNAANGTLSPNDPAGASVQPGAGPRHFSFHPSGKYGYVINEIDRTVTAFEYDADAGTLESIQTITTVPAGFTSGSTAEVLVHPSGKFLYGSNRGHDSIVVYEIDQDSGMLTYVEHESTRGKTPRGFGIDPTGRWLIAGNQSTNTLSVYRIDQEEGRLEAVGDPVPCPTPVCVQFYPLP